MRDQLTAATGILSSREHAPTVDPANVLPTETDTDPFESASDHDHANAVISYGHAGTKHEREEQQTDAQSLTVVNVSKRFVWASVLVERTICDDSCHKAVSPFSARLLECKCVHVISIQKF